MQRPGCRPPTVNALPSAQPQFWRDPALPFAESRRTQHSRACYRAHSHATLSIGVVDEGESIFRSSGHSTPLAAGSLVSVPAGRVHACNPVPGSTWSYQMLHLDAAWAAQVLQHGGAAGLPGQAHVLHSAVAYGAFCTLNATLFSSAPAAHKAQALTDFLLHGAWRHDALPVPGPARPSAAVARVLSALHERPCDPWPLPALAQLAGMTPQALTRAMRAATGLTPHAYQIDLRINAARQRLRAGKPLAAVAHEVGFYDQSHFHHSFHERVAATPRRYQHAGQHSHQHD